MVKHGPGKTFTKERKVDSAKQGPLNVSKLPPFLCFLQVSVYVFEQDLNKPQMMLFPYGN